MTPVMVKAHLKLIWRVNLRSTLETLKKTKKVEMVPTSMQMVISTSGNGQKINAMVLGFT